MYHAGTSTKDVTPPLGYRLQGHEARKRPSDRVHDSLSLKALSLSDGSRRVLMVTSDLICFSPDFAAEVKDDARRELGLRPEQVLLTAAHVHTGPFLLVTKPEQEPNYLPDYVARLRKDILDALREAIANEAPVTLEWGHGTTDIGIVNRRRITPQGVEMQPNPDGPVDLNVLVLAARGENGALRAVLANYACHPTSLGMDVSEVSADFPGAMQHVLEAHYPGATAMFANGCCGDVRPRLVKDDRFRDGTFEDVERMGGALAAGVIAALEQAEPVTEGEVAGRLVTVDLPLDPDWLPVSPERLKAAAAHHLRKPKLDEAQTGAWYTPPDAPAVAAWETSMEAILARGETPPASVPMDVQVLAVGPLRLIGIAGEVMTRIGQRIKTEIGPRAMVCSCANGVMGYIPTAAALPEGGYETKSFLYRKYAAPFAPAMEDVLVRQAVALGSTD